MKKSNEIKTPISEYKKGVLVYLKQLWKSENADIWCAIYTFIKHYTENERLRMKLEKEVGRA